MMCSSKQVDLDKLADDHRSSELQELNFSDTGVYQDGITKTEVSSVLENDLSNFQELENVYVDFSCPPFRDMVKGTRLRSKEDGKGFLVVSAGKIKDSSSRSRKGDDENVHVSSRKNGDPEENDKKLSTNEKIRIAGQRFIESCSSKDDATKISKFSVSFPGISDDAAKDIKLLLMLLSSAEKTCQRQFDCARKLVDSCSNMSSNEGNTIERLVYYFSEAIREKINREIGRDAEDGLERMQMFDLQEAVMSIEASICAFHQKVPLVQVCRFNAIHTIIENVREARKIHVIDLEIRQGMKYNLLLQALASHHDQNVEHIRITAIGTRAESKIKDTGKRLSDLAKSMNINFSFEIVMVSDVLDFSVDHLKLEVDEKVAVYSPFFLSTLIAKPTHLEHLMRELRKINPCITVVAEVEANHTSPVFVNRFIEALFFYGAFFDGMSCCLAHDDRDRKVSECVYFGQIIRNIVAAEGDERTIRHIGVDVWRKFFARFGMAEIELSGESLFEAKRLVSGFDCGRSCAIRVDGGCLMVDWEDLPVFSVSGWKFV